jgi:hypothetical protein
MRDKSKFEFGAYPAKFQVKTPTFIAHDFSY